LTTILINKTTKTFFLVYLKQRQFLQKYMLAPPPPRVNYCFLDSYICLCGIRDYCLYSIKIFIFYYQTLFKFLPKFWYKEVFL
jgi:hypothetical protein